MPSNTQIAVQKSLSNCSAGEGGFRRKLKIIGKNTIVFENLYSKIVYLEKEIFVMILVEDVARAVTNVETFIKVLTRLL